MLSFIMSLFFAQNGFIDDTSSFKSELLKRINCSAGKKVELCPINGGWSDWSVWGVCKGECGQVGLRERTRTCTEPTPKRGGLTCVGKAHQEVECRMPGCTEEDYEELLCADVLRSRELKFIKGIHLKYPSLIERCLKAECHFSIPDNILKNNAGRYWNALHCVKHNIGCPVAGGWSEWGKWNDCSAWCGTGFQLRCRTCDQPRPTYGDLFCKGGNCTQKSCQGVNCDLVKGGLWAVWTSWSSCSSTCGQGLRKRTRKCSGRGWTIGPKEKYEDYSEEIVFTGNFSQDNYRTSSRRSRLYSHAIGNQLSLSRATSLCLGSYTELEPCYLKTCPVDGSWSDWEPWSQCSHGCGLGTQSRSRSCSSPAASNGGAPCSGPFTTFRRCFLQPCQELSHEVAVFDGDGLLFYFDRGIKTRLLHIYVKFRTFKESGTILLRTPKIVSKRSSSLVKLSLIAGYLILFVSVGKCHLSVVSHFPIELKEWTKVLIMLTGVGASLRLNENKEYIKQKFSCDTKLPNFKAEMKVGVNFTGQIEKLYVNFLERYLKLPLPQVNKHSNLYPRSSENVEYEMSTAEETYRHLDELIFIPCSEKKFWSIELIIKTTEQDGLLMLMKNTTPGTGLILSLEPRRVQLHMISTEGVLDVFKVIEPHLDTWLHLKVDYAPDMTYGLSVNGEPRKKISIFKKQNKIICTNNFIIGDIAEEVKSFLFENPLRSLIYESLDGVLAFVRVDEDVIDIETLPAEVKEKDTLVSSETVGASAYYDEVEVSYNHKTIILSCVSSQDSSYDWKNNGNLSTPTWLHFDSPIQLHHNSLIGLNYKIRESSFFSTLNIVNISSRDAVEGFYSCWIPKGEKSAGNILLTYGVTIVDQKNEFSSKFRMIVRSTFMFSSVLTVVIILWLSVEHYNGLKTGWGPFSSMSVRKRIRSEEIFEILHK